MVSPRQAEVLPPPTTSFHLRPASYGGQGRECAAHAASVLPATMSWREFCELPKVNAPHLVELSPAERVVAMQVAQGLSNREIAHALGKSEFTVKHQVSAILHKLNVPSRGRLIVLLR